MQRSSEGKHSPDKDSDLETKLTHDFYKQPNFANSSQEFHEEEVEKGTSENEEEEEFSFTCGGADASPIAAEDAFTNGQIKPILPLFVRDFFSTHDESDALNENLPRKPPVKKFFVETKESVESSSENAGGDATLGGFRDRKAVEVSTEVCKKSNSTGFSKIWRFKDFLGRSNSDGRDAFVFLNAPAVREKVERKVAANKGKTASLSAHEVYLRSKAKDGEKRRSYLPYRPELMGFFTNVNSGLSKNVHPY